MGDPTFTELHGIPDVPQQGNPSALTGKYVSTLAELHGRKIFDIRQTSAAGGVTAHGCAIDGVAMFVDIGAFTGRSKDLELGQVNFWTNRFFSDLWPVCETHHATFDKAIGDAALLVFSPKLGCETPLLSAMQVATAALRFDYYGYHPHVGMAQGKLWLGYSGPPAALSLTVLGSVVNLASRLAGEAKEREICLCRDTWHSVSEDVQLGDEFSTSESTVSITGFGNTPFVKLKCNTEWFPQCAVQLLIV